MIGTLPGPNVLAGRSGRSANSTSFHAALLFLLVLESTYWLGHWMTLRPTLPLGSTVISQGIFFCWRRSPMVQTPLIIMAILLLMNICSAPCCGVYCAGDGATLSL